MSTTDTATDFLQGQKDCQDHIPHKLGQSLDYDRGWGTEYIAIQVRAARRIRHGK